MLPTCDAKTRSRAPSQVVCRRSSRCLGQTDFYKEAKAVLRGHGLHVLGQPPVGRAPIDAGSGSDKLSEGREVAENS